MSAEEADRRAAQFDEFIHAPMRLRICAILNIGGEVSFATIRDTLAASDATVSKHLRGLLERGYVSQRKQQGEPGHAYPTTWVSLTASGRSAFQAHLAALRTIAADPLGNG